jgi:S-formylglutathione hydrolase FrmB
MNKTSLLLLALLIAPGGLSFGDERKPTKIGAAKVDGNGFRVHSVEREYQAGPTEIKVLQPDTIEKDRRHPVVYVLPVEKGSESRFGYGLLEVKKLDLHNKLGVIFVSPTFAHLPWYADHPTNPAIRQETYFLDVVVPFIEKEYPVSNETRGRLLLGFSKSGWGAFSLLLRHPDRFGKAVAWDAPLTMKRPQFGMGDIVQNLETFEKYRIEKLLEQQAKVLGTEKRLCLAGYANFHEHHQAIHDRMVELKIPHEYRDEKKAKHTWDAGWIEDSVRFLIDAAKK